MSKPMSSKSAARVTEIRPNLHMIGGTQGGSNCYLLKGRDRVVLIDTGLAPERDALFAAIASTGCSVRDIDLVILTHEHADHIGSIAELGQTALIAAHPLAANKIMMGDSFAQMNGCFGVKAVTHAPDILVPETTAFEIGNFSLNVMHTPGHCSGHIALYEAKHRLLFGGDLAFAGGILGGILGSGSIGDYMGSLRRMKSLRVDLLLPGHGRPSEHAEADFDAVAARLKQLQDGSQTVIDAIETGPGFEQIMQSLRGLNR
jgi:glyoxylase-like metal-dependent hydrolase (beta-lactamase superfamily II)